RLQGDWSSDVCSSDLDLLAVRGDEVDREQVVHGQAVLALQSAHAAAQRQAGDARVADNPDGTHKAMRLRCLVELRQVRAALRAHSSADWIDRYLSHSGEVKDHPAVARRESRDAVPATAHGRDQLLLAREADGG